MPTFEVSTTIAAPPEAVFRRLADVVAWPEWLATVEAVEPLDGRELAVGRRFRVLQPRLRPAIWVVSLLDPPRRFVWESRAPGIVTRADHVVADPPGGGAQVVLRIEFAGWVGALAGRLMGSLTRRYIATEAATLKQLAEEAAARGA